MNAITEILLFLVLQKGGGVFGVEEEISAFLLSGYVLRPSGTEYRFLNPVEFHSVRTGILLTFYSWSILTDSKLDGCSVTGSPVFVFS